MLGTEEKKLKPLADLVSLHGKTCLITGSASGIGKAMAYRFAEAGADLQLVDIDGEKLETAQRDLRKFGTDVSVFKVNLGKKEEIDGLWGKLEGKEPDVLVNNAGIYPLKDFIQLHDKTMGFKIWVHPGDYVGFLQVEGVFVTILLEDHPGENAIEFHQAQCAVYLHTAIHNLQGVILGTPSRCDFFNVHLECLHHVCVGRNPDAVSIEVLYVMGIGHIHEGVLRYDECIRPSFRNLKRAYQETPWISSSKEDAPIRKGIQDLPSE